MRKKKYYAIVNNFNDMYTEGEISHEAVKQILTTYRETVCPALCKYNYNMSRKQALRLCDSLGYGNWQKIWLAPEEEAESTEDLCRVLIGDVFYCSDRMSWDRLARINWQYLRLLKRLEGDENEGAEY